ncbi:CATRA system-associated protein [Streptomyces sp. NPDC007901]|uniref:CATRA system-associated protein n=1 Tax=Streptomyces sp. NPDC007901 TaxID=3364785 RepID=UPI0036E85708
MELPRLQRKADGVDGHWLDRQMLADVLHWRVGPPMWEQIEQLLTRVTASLDEGDLTGLRRDVTYLALLGPSRVSTPINPDIGDSDQTRTVPAHVAELVNTLVDRLAPDQSGTPAQQPGD